MDTYTGSAVILWMGVYQSALLVPVLLLRRGGNRLANRLLAAFLALMGGRLASVLAMASYPDWNWPTWIELALPLAFLYGPLFYFYLRAFLERSFRLRRMHRWHLLPAGLALLVKGWVLLRFPDQTFAWSGPPEATGLTPVFVATRVMFALIFAGYLFWGLRLIFRFRRRVWEEASFSEAIHLRWLAFLVGVLLLPVASVLLTLLALGVPEPGVIPLQRLAPYPAYGVSLMMAILAGVTMLRPEVLDGLPEVLKVEDEDDLAPQRYESSALTEAQKQRYLAQLQAHMDQAQPYLDQQLTLSTLADQLGLNSKYLSQVINEKLDQNFLDFINGYRVAQAQALLRDPAYRPYTVVAIAHEVGFKSKSAFYTAFKKGTGVTPTAWRAGAASAF